MTAIDPTDGVQRNLATKTSIRLQFSALLLMHILNIYNMLIQELHYESLNLIPDGQQQFRKIRVKVSIFPLLWL